MHTAENQEERLFSMRQHSYFGVTHCENSEVQIAVFSKWNMLRGWKLDKDLFSIYLQPSVNTISQNLVLLTLQSDDVTLKTINRITHSRSVVLNSWPHLMAYRHIGIFRKTHLGWNVVTGFSFADQLLQLLPDLPWYVNNYKLRSVLFVC